MEGGQSLLIIKREGRQCLVTPKRLGGKSHFVSVRRDLQNPLNGLPSLRVKPTRALVSSCPRARVPSCPRVGGDEPHCAQDVWRARDVESHFDLRDDPDPRFAVWGEPPKTGGGGFREEVSNSGRRRPLMIDCLL